MTTTELNQLIADRKKAMQDKIASKKLELEAKYVQSDLFEKRTLEQEDLDTLSAIDAQIDDILEVDNRKKSYVFGFGSIPDRILSICKTIRYLKTHERDELMTSTGLNEILLDELLDAFGATAYFSMKESVIVPAIPMDIEATKSLLEEVATKMGLVSPLNLSKFSEANVDYQYKRAQVRAEESKELTDKYNNQIINYDE